MTRQEQEKHFNELTEKMKAILYKKREDYSSESDVLSNFKLVGAITGLSPARVALVLMAVKIVRLGELTRSESTGSGVTQGKNPKNESIEDSSLDLGNYNALFEMLLSEETNEDANSLIAQRDEVLEKNLLESKEEPSKEEPSTRTGAESDICGVTTSSPSYQYGGMFKLVKREIFPAWPTVPYIEHYVYSYRYSRDSSQGVFDFQLYYDVDTKTWTCGDEKEVGWDVDSGYMELEKTLDALLYKQIPSNGVYDFKVRICDGGIYTKSIDIKKVEVGASVGIVSDITDIIIHHIKHSVDSKEYKEYLEIIRNEE